MFQKLVKKLRTKRRENAIDPDEVLLDSFNLPSFDISQFEGKVERSIKGSVPFFVGASVFVIAVAFMFQIWHLQVVRGGEFAVLSDQNHLKHDVLFAERGVVYDRNGEELAWNELSTNEEQAYAQRRYTARSGFAHVLGFLAYPQKDAAGNWWRTEYDGKAGVERSLNEKLAGINGVRIVEVDALNSVQSQNTIQEPQDGESVTLSIDAPLQEALFEAVQNGAARSGFVAGAAVLMDVKSSEVLALVSAPEFDSGILTEGTEQERIVAFNSDPKEPFLNRALSGEYAPGSIVKPYVAAAALAENIISPGKQIHSTGALRIPNPYFPGRFSIFREWKAGGHGWVNMREAIAVSSNEYFYTVGGGFGNQEGLGIERLAKYANLFGLGRETGINLGTESIGVVPTPKWKEEVFGEDDPWLIGNTYHTSIGQFGFLMTPIQAVRYAAALANGGTLLKPHIERGASLETENTQVPDEDLQIIREGMRRSVQTGTASSLNVPGLDIAAKTGTAQLGKNNEYMNSWVIGFWPSNDPQFAFAAVLEKAPAETLAGAAPAMRSFFEHLAAHEPEYAAGTYRPMEDSEAI